MQKPILSETDTVRLVDQYLRAHGSATEEELLALSRFETERLTTNALHDMAMRGEVRLGWKDGQVSFRIAETSCAKNT